MGLHIHLYLKQFSFFAAVATAPRTELTGPHRLPRMRDINRVTHSTVWIRAA